MLSDQPIIEDNENNNKGGGYFSEGMDLTEGNKEEFIEQLTKLNNYV